MRTPKPRRTLVIPGRLPTRNTLYANGNRWKRRKLANEWHERVRVAALDEDFCWPTPCTIEVIRYGIRVIDCDNVEAKLVIDGLVKAGLLPDDSPEYIEAVTTRSRKDRNERVVVTALGLE